MEITKTACPYFTKEVEAGNFILFEFVAICFFAL